jgi:threonine dehydrogenase-like Zn-dependent dehydrogenase
MSELKIVFTADETAVVAPDDLHEAPLKADEVAGHTIVSLVSAGTELNMYLGNYDREGAAWASFPCQPGYAAIFKVEQVGVDVKDVKIGDICFCPGKHRTYQREPRNRVVPVPEALDPGKATLARMMQVTMTTLTTTTARPPCKVVVTGLGLVGLLGAMMFEACGYEVIACDPVDDRRNRARQAGLNDVRAAVPVDDVDVAKQVGLVLECSGHEQAVLDGCKVVEPRGEVVCVGVPMVRHTDIYAQQVLNELFRNNATLRGGSEWGIPRYPTAFRHNNIFSNLAAALRWLNEGRIDVGDWLEPVSPDDAQQVYQNVKDRKMTKLAYLFEWAD